MNALFDHAKELLDHWKSGSYAFGVDDAVFGHVGRSARGVGKSALVVVADWGHPWCASTLAKVEGSLGKAGMDYQVIAGASPNAPREDVYRIALAVSILQPDCLVAVGGGSTIDAVKAAASLARFTPAEKIDVLGCDPADASSIEPLFGVDRITTLREATGRAIVPIIAVQTAASSGAHLTKYANVTDPVRGIKKLEVDYAHVPVAAAFDYRVTQGAPAALKTDGALDGIAHCWEVFMGASGKSYYPEIADIATTAIDLIVASLPAAVDEPRNVDAHVGLGLGTDLGGYAIMIEKTNPQTGQIERGGTNGGHLGSFQLTDFLSHGRACALLNPYYTVLFAEAIEDQCLMIGRVFQKHGYIDDAAALESLTGRERAMALANGMIRFAGRVGFPTTLDAAGVPNQRIAMMVEQSENPQLRSKLENMPVPMNAQQGDVRRLLQPTLEAAFAGDLERIPVSP